MIKYWLLVWVLVLVNQGFDGFSDGGCDDGVCWSMMTYYEWEHWEVLPDDTPVSIPDGSLTVTNNRGLSNDNTI